MPVEYRRRKSHHLFACDVRRRLGGVSLRAETIESGDGVLADGLLSARAAQHGAFVNVCSDEI